MDDRERIHRAIGKPPSELQPSPGHGAPSNRRWIVRFDDGSTAFAKVAAFDYTADWLRLERRNYELLDGAPFVAQMLGWYDDGSEPALLLEDLQDAFWPPPWTASHIDAVLASLAAIRATPAPDGIGERFGAMFDFQQGWESLLTDPTRAVALGAFDRASFDANVADLVAAARQADLAGEALMHADVRSDNLCIRGGRAILVDWNWACRGHPSLDLIAWLPSLRNEGGPDPWLLAPSEGALASLLAGFFLEHAGKDPIPQAPHVRQLQLDQGVEALRWACHELGIEPPA